MNKKGQVFDVARKTIYWMLAGVLITAVILAFAFGLAGYRNKLTKVPSQLQAEFIALRFTTNSDCFAVVENVVGMKEDTKRSLPGTIDLAKFTKETMERCYRTEQKKGYKTFNFRLKLEQGGQEIITNNYFHHDRDDLTIKKDVSVQKEGAWEEDTLVIYVQERIGP